MEKDKVVEVILKHIRDKLEDLEDEEMNINKSMKDYGANSLDIIEVVSSSMRELSIKVPRTELADLETISQLADKFVEHSQ